MGEQGNNTDNGFVAIVFITIIILLSAHIYTGYDNMFLQIISALISVFWICAALYGVYIKVADINHNFEKIHWFVSLLTWCIIGLILAILWNEFRFVFWVFASLTFVVDIMLPLSKKYFN